MEIFESHSIGRQPEIFMKFEFRAEHSKFQQFRRKQNNIGYGFSSSGIQNSVDICLNVIKFKDNVDIFFNGDIRVTL